MKGAIIGDMIGCHGPNGKESLEEKLMATSCTFSECTLLTLGTAKALLKGADAENIYRDWGIKYAHAKSSNGFSSWLRHSNADSLTWRYGAAIRVSPLALIAKDVKEAEHNAEMNARITHPDVENILGARAVSAAMYMAHHGLPKQQIKTYLHQRHMYSHELPADVNDQELNPVETAIRIFLNAESLETTMKKASALPNTSVIASIAGELAHAHYKTIPRFMLFNAFRVLPAELVQVMAEFNKQYKINY